MWDNNHFSNEKPDIPEVSSFVMIKLLTLKSLEARWDRPFDVLLTTDTSECVGGKGIGSERWKHWSQIKPCNVDISEETDENCAAISFGWWLGAKAEKVKGIGGLWRLP